MKNQDIVLILSGREELSELVRAFEVEEMLRLGFLELILKY